MGFSREISLTLGIVSKPRRRETAEDSIARPCDTHVSATKRAIKRVSWLYYIPTHSAPQRSADDDSRVRADPLRISSLSPLKSSMRSFVEIAESSRAGPDYLKKTPRIVKIALI
jgi:hypothetical protein